VLNASLALFDAKGSWSPNPFKVLVPVASALISFVSSASFVVIVSYLFFYTYKNIIIIPIKKICFK